jgi:hypothetical protein
VQKSGVCLVVTNRARTWPPLHERGGSGVETDHARLPVLASPDANNSLVEADVGR